MMNSAPTAVRLVALLAVLVFGIAGCEGDEPAAEETVPEATETEVEATETEPLATDTEEPVEPATETETEPATETESPAAMTADGITAALEAEGLAQIAAAVEASDLADQLALVSEFTIFAPSDDAFAESDMDIQAMLETEDADEDLQNIVAYHVTDERVSTADIVGEETLNTLEGSPLTISVEDDTVMVGDQGATVTEADIELGESGTVHVIDQVLEPARP